MKAAAALLALATTATHVAAHATAGARRHAHVDIARSLSGRDVEPPAGWLTDYLEPYLQYHIRYLAIDCEAKHNTSFFADCCHPILATETLQTVRKAKCIPTTAESASAAAEVSTAAPLSGAAISASTDSISVSTPAAPATTSAPVNVGAPPPSSSSFSSSSSHSKKKHSTTAPPPPPTTTYGPTSSAAPTSSASGNSGSSSGGGAGGLAGVIGELFSGGIATFFWQNGVAGACGTVHPDSAYIIALETAIYGNGEHCGKQVVLQDINTGNTQYATVADECPTCDNSDSIDLSHGLFSAFASDDQGEFNVQWGFTGN